MLGERTRRGTGKARRRVARRWRDREQDHEQERRREEEQAPLDDALVELRLASRRRLRRAAEQAEGRQPEDVLLDGGLISIDEVVSAARRRWLRRHREEAGPGAAALEAAPLCGVPSGGGVATARARLARRARTSALCLTTAALVISVEIAVTLAWKEPLSAALASRAQAQLSDELDRLETSALSYREAGRRARARANRAELAAEAKRATRFAGTLAAGEAVGRIELAALDQSFVVVQGTGSGELAKGPGHFADTELPGEGKTVAIAGHRTTYGAPFRNIDKLANGDRIVVDMPYGRFTYLVEKKRVVSPDAYWVTGDAGRERLVLTSCHPLYSAAQRMVVFARRV